MKLVHELDHQTWRDFVDRHPQGNVFHTPEMFYTFAHAKGYQPELWAITESDGTPIALFVPVTITLFKAMARWFSTRVVSFGSVLCVDSARGKKALDKLLRTYTQQVNRNVLFTELRNISDISHIDSLLAQNGFEYEEHLNFFIYLGKGSEEVLQNIGSRTRKKIRKGLREKTVKINEITNLSELKPWYEILAATYRHAQTPLADYSLFEAAYHYLFPQKMAKFLIGTIDGQAVACSLELPYKNRIYGWYGGSDRHFSKFHPNELLNWYIMDWGATHNYEIYDFGGAGKPNESYGVRDFKAKFGGELVGLGRYICVHAPGRLKLSQFVYKLYKRSREWQRSTAA